MRIKNTLEMWMMCGSGVLVLFWFLFSSTAADARVRTYSGSTYDTNYQERESTRYESNSAIRQRVNELGTQSPILLIRIPILFAVKPSDIDDTWGDARSNGRTHEGTDIMAPRGSLVVSPTAAIVTTINTGGNGGNHVFTANPGGERFYYAHLDKFAENLKEGQILEPGDLIGYVGNTGNASGGPTHLHFGIYGNNRVTTNPFPRLTLEFSVKETLDAFTKIINTVSGTPEALARTMVPLYKSTFLAGPKNGVTSVPVVVAKALAEQAAVTTRGSVRTLRVGVRGDDVKWLQQSLIESKAGPAATVLSGSTVDGVFGNLTKNALIEYQKKFGLTPDGVLGPRSRAHLIATYPY